MSVDLTRIPSYVDRLGRRHPHHFSLAALFDACPTELARAFNPIPAEFWVQVEDGMAQVSCPCGEAPVVPIAGLAGCGCGRWFIYLGDDVLAALGPTKEVDENPERESDPAAS